MIELIAKKLPYLIDLPGHVSETGKLNYWDDRTLFPSGIERCFWISDVKAGETRGNHAHIQESQVIIAMAGVLEVEVTHVTGEILKFKLQSSSTGLYIPPLNWVSIIFSESSVLLGLCDQAFSEDDFIRNKQDFENYQYGNE
ncbi:FdtA/QdtA family cupin domain-containing protein [Algoriphagus lutimaris]|uniref:sugar 3,4-ketoisomerase n=1 Tax=Algoriphagus lutimaris TaxID=613197 RepID=UPI00196AFB9E|nr:FdtA/QdtA family cupin domain-containing protein [Algoriphagus lutimaris]MBN3520150.1 FdtA/QdtA family cupin domain-containing protein [Algoriphagus lutimaris]